MKGLAELIIEEFERNMPIPTTFNDWDINAEEIMLYLAAKKYVEKY